MLHVTIKHLLGMTGRCVLRELLMSLVSVMGRNNVSAATILITSYQSQAQSDTMLRFTRTYGQWHTLLRLYAYAVAWVICSCLGPMS